MTPNPDSSPEPDEEARLVREAAAAWERFRAESKRCSDEMRALDGELMPLLRQAREAGVGEGELSIALNRERAKDLRAPASGPRETRAGGLLLEIEGLADKKSAVFHQRVVAVTTVCEEQIRLDERLREFGIEPADLARRIGVPTRLVERLEADPDLARRFVPDTA